MYNLFTNQKNPPMLFLKQFAKLQIASVAAFSWAGYVCTYVCMLLLFSVIYQEHAALNRNANKLRQYRLIRL